MEISRLYECVNSVSESVQTFDSVFVTCRSEPRYLPPRLVDQVPDNKSTSSRRASCPPAMEVPCPAVCPPVCPAVCRLSTVLSTSITTLSSDLSPHGTLSSVGSLHFMTSHTNVSAAKTAAARQERIKQSLTRLSESIVSKRKATTLATSCCSPCACERDACVGTSFISATVRRHSTGSNTMEGLVTQRDEQSRTIRLDQKQKEQIAHQVEDQMEDEISSASSHDSRLAAALFRKTMRDEEEDLLSPVSSIRPMGTLRIHPNQLPLSAGKVSGGNWSDKTSGTVAGASNGGGWFDKTMDSKKPTPAGGFRPSPVGAQLMQIFSHSNPPGVATQARMWDAFLSKSKPLPIEFADVQNRMPTVVFTLRGLLRFGDGDYGTTRTDCLAPFIQILIGRHPVCETPACMEAVESVCALLNLLAVYPQRMQLRPRFESVLLAQHCIVLQQIFGILAQQVTKWLEIEQSKTADQTPLTNSAVGALLDIVYIHCADAKLRNGWTPHASLPRLITSVGERLPLQIAKCVNILDLLLDRIAVADQPLVSRQTAQSLHAAIGQVKQSAVAGVALKAIQNWADKKPTLFSKTLFGGTKKLSLKSAIYAEYKSLI